MFVLLGRKWVNTTDFIWMMVKKVKVVLGIIVSLNSCLTVLLDLESSDFIGVCGARLSLFFSLILKSKNDITVITASNEALVAITRLALVVIEVIIIISRYLLFCQF